MHCKKFDDILMNIIRSDNQIKKRLYHYTSLEKLRSIISSRALWMNSYRSLNDRMEILVGKELCLEVLRKIDTDNRYINGIERLYEKGYFCVTISFCTENNLYEMWHTYADNFKGAVIEFNNENIEKKITLFEKNINAEDSRPRKKILAGEVYYKSHNDTYEIFNLFEQKYKELSMECIGHNDLHRDIMTTYMLGLSSIIKHYYYNIEHEYRICCFAVLVQDDNLSQQVQSLKFKKNNVILINDNQEDYRILFDFNYNDILNIYLVGNSIFNNQKQKLVAELSKKTGFDFTDKIIPLKIDNNAIENFKPHKIELI